MECLDFIHADPIYLEFLMKKLAAGCD